MTPRKTCVECGSEFTKHARESYADFDKRSYCGKPCANAARTTPMRERLLKKAVRAENGCLVWTGQKDAHGYGVISTKFRQRPALVHRASYMEFVGPIPEGMVVRHRCDNPPCLEPSHLELGDQRQNMADKAKRGRAGVRLTLAQAGAIKARAAAGERSADLAAEFGVSRTTIKNIKSGRFWSGQVPVGCRSGAVEVE